MRYFIEFLLTGTLQVNTKLAANVLDIDPNIRNFVLNSGFIYSRATLSLPGLRVRQLRHKSREPRSLGLQCRTLAVVGYNHNIQSSFGVTASVKRKIRNWFASVLKEGMPWDPLIEMTGNASTTYWPTSMSITTGCPAFKSRGIGTYT
jgi:hypothetical protein